MAWRSRAGRRRDIQAIERAPAWCENASRGRTRMLKIRFVALSAGALALGFAGPAFAEPGITAKTIIIGQSAGFTGSVAGTVKELTAGAKAYFDAVNAKGGVHGRRIVLESMDDGFDPKKTPDVVAELIQKKNVFAMFLSRGTPTNEAALPVLEKFKVPLIGPSTGAMSMYEPPRK